ncbi:YesN/AraC family two-component response regulator [Paenibacillus wynnii]|nr:YesN/AraC family two-component response regulator [Paenibacillus wynnii]
MSSLISVLLVDDEPLALDNVYHWVPWRSTGTSIHY